MKVLLKQDVPGLGKLNEVKTVSDGYARNYLIPRGLAIPADQVQVKLARDQVVKEQTRVQREREHAQRLIDRLQGSPLHLTAKAGETGRLYGSITSADIAEAIQHRLGVPFDKHWIVLERPIRDLGMHTVDLKLDAGVRGQVSVEVEAEPHE